MFSSNSLQNSWMVFPNVGFTVLYWLARTEPSPWIDPFHKTTRVRYKTVIKFRSFFDTRFSSEWFSHRAPTAQNAFHFTRVLWPVRSYTSWLIMSRQITARSLTCTTLYFRSNICIDVICADLVSFFEGKYSVPTIIITSCVHGVKLCSLTKQTASK